VTRVGFRGPLMRDTSYGTEPTREPNQQAPNPQHCFSDGGCGGCRHDHMSRDRPGCARKSSGDRHRSRRDPRTQPGHLLQAHGRGSALFSRNRRLDLQGPEPMRGQYCRKDYGIRKRHRETFGSHRAGVSHRQESRYNTPSSSRGLKLHNLRTSTWPAGGSLSRRPVDLGDIQS
jgi:hypothetical protein